VQLSAAQQSRTLSETPGPTPGQKSTTQSSQMTLSIRTQARSGANANAAGQRSTKSKERKAIDDLTEASNSDQPPGSRLEESSMRRIQALEQRNRSFSGEQCFVLILLAVVRAKARGGSVATSHSRFPGTLAGKDLETQKRQAVEGARLKRWAEANNGSWPTISSQISIREQRIERCE